MLSLWSVMQRDCFLGYLGTRGYQGWALYPRSPGEAEVLAHPVVRGGHPGPGQQQVLALLPTCPTWRVAQF